MDFVVTIINSVMAVILGGILGLWIYFLGFMVKSFRLAPRLESFKLGASYTPRVSVILPARNEERYIARCLDTLLAQDYSNFQIIAINDSSTDATGKIMGEYSKKDPRVVYLDAPPKPDGWAGKNWACYQGYLRSEGEFLMFTDADTEHASNTMSLAVQHMESQNLDALTAVPHLVCNDFWTKITLPSLATFLHTRFSPLRVNDPRVKTGYFFGSFFVITRKTYEAVGTHEGVRQELVEDGALGGKVKSANFRMKMVRGERHIDAIWARDLSTLWHGLRRLMIPLYYQDKVGAGLMTLAVFFILLVPFLVLPYTVFASGLAGNISATVLVAIQMASVLMIIGTTALQCQKGVFENPAYALAAPVSGALVSFGFLSAIVDAKRRRGVNWRDRQYTVSENQHPIY
jgi:cellulose synthase/poly-beta-1,6-N-acetylglucosamine synthase-like glycosyltransferase